MCRSYWPTPGTGESCHVPTHAQKPKGRAVCSAFSTGPLDTECLGFLFKLLKIKENSLFLSPKEHSTDSVCPGPLKGEWPQAKVHLWVDLLLVLVGGRVQEENKSILTLCLCTN